MQPPKPLDAVAQITVTYYADGQLSCGGHIGDKAFAVKLLQHAIDAIRATPRPEDKPLILPSRDVALTQHPNYPTRPLGDR